MKRNMSEQSGIERKSLIQRLKERLLVRRRIRRSTRFLHYQLASLQYRLPKEVLTVYQRYARHPESREIVSRLDAAVIYHLIRKHRPNHCMDLGCGLGTTTAVAAMAMEDNGVGQVTSLEQLDWMTELAWAMLPDGCKGRVEILHRELEIREYFGEKWACYRFSPEKPDIDFVVVDGPYGTREDASGNSILLPNGDLLEFLPFLKPGCRVFIDGRLFNVAAYRRYLGDKFRIRQSRLDYTLMEMKKVASSAESLEP